MGCNCPITCQNKGLCCGVENEKNAGNQGENEVITVKMELQEQK